MARPGIITGGDLLNAFGTRSQRSQTEFFADVKGDFTPTQRRGVYAASPGSTPKYASNRGHIKAEYEDTTARLFVDLPEGERRTAFVNSVSERARPLAKVLTSGAGTGGSGSTGFIDFILTNANENFQEKAQIVDTLTDNYVAYYSGQEPPVFGYSGVLLNTYQDDQRVWMLLMYSEILRGTRLAHRNLVANLRYDSFIVSGYLETLSLGLSGETDNTASQFSFTMRIKSMQIITDALAEPTLNGSSATGTSRYTRDTAGVITGSTLDPRNATITSLYPTVSGISNRNGPTASRNETLTIAEQERTLEVLRASGKTDAEIQGIITLSKNAESVRNNSPNFDPRSQVTDPNTQAVDRLVVSAVGTDVTKSNTDNINTDGQQGASNVRGPERPPVSAMSPQTYSPPFSQSGLTPNNTVAAQTVSNAAQGYQSLKAKLKAIRKKRTRGRYVQETTITGSDGQPVKVRITT